MNVSFLATLPFEGPLEVLIILAILAAFFLRHVPQLLNWLIAFFVVVSLFPDNFLAGQLGGLLAQALGPILALGMMILGFRIMLGGVRPQKCSHCGCRHCCGDCRRTL